MSKKKAKVSKTLVEKMLDQQKINYQSIVAPTVKDGDVDALDTENFPKHDVTVYKTLVLKGTENPVLVGVVPLDKHLSYKKLSQISGDKKVHLLPLKDLEKTTGYVHGANTPIGIYEKLKVPIFYDQQADLEDEIIVSAGKVGRSVQIKVSDLIDITAGQFGDIAEEK
ncbi:MULTISPECIES: YbaK/EbsC family protein [Holzapfeliella]